MGNVGPNGVAMDVGRNGAAKHCLGYADLPFVSVPIPNLKGIRMPYQGLPFVEDNIEERAPYAMWAMYPFPEPVTYDLLNGTIPPSEPMTYKTAAQDVYWYMYRRPGQFPAGTLLYGFVPLDSFAPGVWGGTVHEKTASAGVGQGGLFRATYSHESGHALGRFAEGEGGSNTDEYGWDVVNRMPDIGECTYPGHLPGIRLKSPFCGSFMEQGVRDYRAWVSPELSEKVLTKAKNPPTSLHQTFAVASLAPEVSGQPWSLGYAYEFADELPPIEQLQGGAAETRVIDLNGTTTFTTTLDVPVECAGPGCSQNLGASAVVSTTNDTVALQLYRDGVFQDAITRTLNAPTLVITSPTQGASLTDPFLVNWEAMDIDGDSLLWSVFYRHDNSSWMPVAADVITTSFTVSTSGLPAGESSQIRVVTTDGNNTSYAQVAGLTKGPNLPPRAAISSPADGQVLRQGAMLTVISHTSDPEDGQLPASSIHWYSNLDGYLGSGPMMSLVSPAASVDPLSSGTHQLELRVFDSAGAQTSAFVTLVVQ